MLAVAQTTPTKRRPALTWEQLEVLACAEDVSYFIRRYVHIFDAASEDWIKFDLWPAQEDVLRLIDRHKYSILLKPRQVGISWLQLAYILHGMLFKPIFEAGIFSKRENEAFYLLGEERLKGMYGRLPTWMQARSVTVDSASQFRLSNGSGARAFPWNAGDSYTLSYVLVDEADLVPDLRRVMRSVKPTIDAGGKISLVSRPDKSKPQSPFKQIYLGARRGENEWGYLFLPWYVHPGRDQAWYDRQKRDTLSNTGSLDDLHEQYPSSDDEALAGRSMDKRIPAQWLSDCFAEEKPLPLEGIPAGAPAIPGLQLFRAVENGVEYVIGADPAEGNPTSDDSSMHVIRKDTNEEVAMLAGKFQPHVFASYISQLGQYFNRADVICERNNHGHAVLLWLRDNSPLKLLQGLDKKEGWMTNSVSKARMYDNAVSIFHEVAALIHSFRTRMQLGAIEGSTLSAPEGEMDDCATSYSLALLHGVMPRFTDYEIVAG
jgi:hypothetical protein